MQVLEKYALAWRASRHPRLTQMSLMLAAHVKNINDDANGALRVTLRAVAKPGLAIEL